MKNSIIVLLAFVILYFTSTFATAFAIVGGGNITNFSNVTGGTVNITGSGYYYFVPGGSTGVNINYTNETIDAAISIETGNVTLDCQYAPQLQRATIAGPRGNPANSPGSVVAGVVVNATRGLGAVKDHVQNVTIRNCIFTNFSSTSHAGIIVNGNVTGLYVYNNTFNDSRQGVVIATNGSSGIYGGQWAVVNISKNTFFNITGANPSKAITFRGSVTSDSAFTNIISVRDSIIEYNNFTSIVMDTTLNATNATNLTIFNNTVYNSFKGFQIWGINNSNASNNNLTNLFGTTTFPLGIALFTPLGAVSPDLSSVPNFITYNHIFNVTCCGSSSIGIATNLSNTNITGNRVNMTRFGIYVSEGNTRFNKFTSNIVGNSTQVAIASAIASNVTLYNNTVLDSVYGIYFSASNDSTLIQNTVSNSDYGYVFTSNAYNIFSQNDAVSNTRNHLYFDSNVNFTAVNFAGNISNISTGTLTAINATFAVPASISVTRTGDGAPLANAALSLLAIGSVPVGISSTLNNTAVLDSTGTAHFNITSFIVVDLHGSLATYNFTPHNFTATLDGYFDGATAAVLPVGSQVSEQSYLVSLLAYPHSYDGDTGDSGGDPAQPPVEPKQETGSTPAPVEQIKVVINQTAVNVTQVNTTINTPPKSGQLSLNFIPALSSIQIDPLIAVAVLVVIILIILVVFGLI